MARRKRAGARIEVFPMFSARVRLIDVTINHLDRPDHEDLGGIASLEEGIALAERNIRLIDLDDALQRIAFRIDHRAVQFLRQQPRRGTPLETAKAFDPWPWLVPSRPPTHGRRHTISRPTWDSGISLSWRHPFGAGTYSRLLQAACSRAHGHILFRNDRDLGARIVFFVGNSIIRYSVSFHDANRLYRQRLERVMLFAGSVVILCAVSSIDLAQFSSRYIFVSLPFLLINLGPSVKLSWHLSARLAFGSTIGLASLLSYLH
jgi:hypothetical protein